MKTSDPNRAKAARDLAAADRDDTAEERDRAASARDNGAKHRDTQAVERELSAIAVETSESVGADAVDSPESDVAPGPLGVLHLRSALARRESWSDRALSAEDRGESAHDRDGAADDRESAARGRSAARLDRQAAGVAAAQALETLETMSDAFVTLDSAWRFTYLNSRAEAILQRERAELIGEIAWSAFPEAAGGPIADAFRHACETGTSVKLDFYYAAGDALLEIRAYPIADGLSVYFCDVTTERRREAVARQTDRLEILGRVTAGVAHDFNNLLTVISGYATIGQDSSQGRQQAAECFDHIVLASNKAAALTRQLLSFGCEQPLSPEPIDLNEAVRNLAPLMTQLLPPHVSLVLEYAPVPVFAFMDASQLDQILMNLVVNGRDAIRGSGTVTVSATAAGPAAPTESAASAWLHVADTGSGIPDDVLPNIFDPYFTTKERDLGTGLGLATIYGIVAQSGGTIEVDTRLGVGTTMSVGFRPVPSRLPVAA